MTGSPVLHGSYWDETGIFDGTRMRPEVKAGNYPNPFSGITRIDVELDRSAPVRVLVYDLTGKLVAGLFEGVMQPGRNSVTFNAENLARGIYIGKAITGGQQSVFKMIAR